MRWFAIANRNEMSDPAGGHCVPNAREAEGLRNCPRCAGNRAPVAGALLATQ
jgi:hypothetical protein